MGQAQSEPFWLLLKHTADSTPGDLNPDDLCWDL